MTTIKKIGLIILVMLVMAACGANPEEQSADTVDSVEGESEQGPQGDQPGDGSRQPFRENLGDGELSTTMQLAVGTILMDDTDLALEVDQTELLIPYWKLYLSLVESDATASEELEAVISEIQDVMTIEQLAYITELELVQEDLITLMSDLGINEGLSLDGEGEGTGFTRPEGMDGMGPGGGQGRGGGMEEMTPELMATMEARREEMGGARGMMGANRMQIPIIEALIELLEGKVE